MSEINIFAYKHDGSFHRKWFDEQILSETKDYIITASPTHTKVLESRGNFWVTKEPAICYFSKKRWFNIIVMYKENEVVYYCNLASPILKELNSLKYIDYDLDIKYYASTKRVLILDKKEFKHNATLYEYPDWISEQVLRETKVLQNWAKNEIGPFSEDFRLFWKDKINKDNNE